MEIQELAVYKANKSDNLLYAGEIRLTFKDPDVRDEVAAVVPPRGDMRLLNNPNMELVASLTQCRLGSLHAERLGVGARQCGLRIQLGFADSTHACCPPPRRVRARTSMSTRAHASAGPSSGRRQGP